MKIAESERKHEKCKMQCFAMGDQYEVLVVFNALNPTNLRYE